MEKTPDYTAAKRDPRNPPSPGEERTEEKSARKEGKGREPTA